MPVKDDDNLTEIKVESNDDDPEHLSAWRNKFITPAQILVNDIRVEKIRKTRGPRLEVIERSPWTFVPSNGTALPPPDVSRVSKAARNPIEKQHFLNLEAEYAWLRHFRLDDGESHVDSLATPAKCRWIHCSSKFEDYLRGFLWALTRDVSAVTSYMQQLDVAIHQHARYSKHGRLFSPFCMSLGHSSDGEQALYPMLMSAPFLDWSVLGQAPPLRFQVDRREGFRSTKNSSHFLRSILQYFYRLEDTSEREASQVFSKYKPWATSRDLDLKVRQWYGHYPTALNVDELWVLVVDATHIVTFSSNQTWKSRSPPLQLTSRICDISFRGIRNNYYNSETGGDFTALAQAVVCMNGAMGMMHRSFWDDFILPATDRYAGYLSHLQYRLHRSPTTKLVMDLIACQEELNIVIQITEQQMDVITEFRNKLVVPDHARSISQDDEWERDDGASEHMHKGTSQVLEPIDRLLDNLRRELTDLRELRDNTDRLVTRTIQLVNIRLEDHGKAILVFTIVTIIFLPLNFVSSFFGMNVSDIRNMSQGQWIFWAVALCVTVAVVGGSVFVAFSGGSIWESFLLWRERRRETRLSSATVSLQTVRDAHRGFRVLGMSERTATFES